MTWDEERQRVAIKAIGQVECGLDYGAVNPVDPISISLFQWYAYNAAKLLNMMKADGSWDDCPAELKKDVEAHPASESSYWTTRYVDAAERQLIAPWLRKPANRAVVDTLAHSDLEEYVKAGEGAGLPRSNSDTMAYFVNMYNQGPRYAFQVLATVGGDATLDEIHAACLRHAVFSRYRTRYNEAYNIIKRHDSSGVSDGVEGTETIGGDEGDVNAVGGAGSDVHYIQQHADKLYMKTNDGSATFYSTGQNTYKPLNSASVSGEARTETGGGGTANLPTTDAQKKVVAWMKSHENKYRYMQAPGRMTPDASGYTDCSGAVRWCYIQTLGINPGVFTGDQCFYGKSVTKSKVDCKPPLLQPGDCIYIRWRANSSKNFDHVEMYIGGDEPNNLMGHGGPGVGPHYNSLNQILSACYSVSVRRFIP